MTRDKERILDEIYWGRQGGAIVTGIAWGVLGWTGFFGIASFCALNSLLVYLYTSHVMGDEEVDDMMEFVKEGFMTAFSSFMVAWIITYSAMIPNGSISMDGI